jgi:NAD-dependent SIR2 family protein deacetylase
MEGHDARCPLCSRLISIDDTVVFGHGHLSHLDCRHPQALSPEERAILYLYCRDHDVGECVACARRFRPFELAANATDGQPRRCPGCGGSVYESVRRHLYACAMLPAEVRRRAQAARDAARELVKRSRQLSEAADVLVQEAEAALEALRVAMRQLPVRRF